jgi:predicted dehydrogenase
LACSGVRAAEAGKDIYCEKPLALTVKEGRAMVNATRKHNRIFQTGSMQRSWPEFRQAVEIIRNGFIGEIKSIKVNVGPPPITYDLPEQPVPDGLDWKKWLGPNEFKPFNAELAPPITQDVYPNWRKYKEFGGGQVSDWGAHMFDIAQWALDMDNSGPTEIFAPDADHPFLTYKYNNGIIMTHEKWEWNNAVLFTGTEAKIARGRRTAPASVKDKIIGDTCVQKREPLQRFLNAMRNVTNQYVIEIAIAPPQFVTLAILPTR